MVDELKYLGSTIQSNQQSTREVRKTLQVGWSGWRWVSGLICDRRTAVRQEFELEMSKVKMLRFSLRAPGPPEG